MIKDHVADVGVEALKAAPAATATVAIVAGKIDPQWFVVIPTALLICLQAAHLLWRWRREAKGK